MRWRSARRSGFAHHSCMLLCVLVSAAISVSSCLSACSSSSASEDPHHTQDGKVVVRVSMYNSSSFPTWREYVEDQCPDVYIQWEDNRNACSNVVYEAEHDDMPDIVAIRRYESDSARNLEPYLADLSGLATTQTIEAKYLAPCADGEAVLAARARHVRWDHRKQDLVRPARDSAAHRPRQLHQRLQAA